MSDSILAIRGAVDKRPGSEEVNLIVNELIPVDQLESRYTRGLRIRVDEKRHGEQGLEHLREILRGYPGDQRVQLVLALSDTAHVTIACDKHPVQLSSELRRRVDELLGPGNVKLISEPPKATPGNGNGFNSRSRAAAK